jgi:hypothetical protein
MIVTNLKHMLVSLYSGTPEDILVIERYFYNDYKVIFFIFFEGVKLMLQNHNLTGHDNNVDF